MAWQSQGMWKVYIYVVMLFDTIRPTACLTIRAVLDKALFAR